jgi:hypothetical protein
VAVVKIVVVIGMVRTVRITIEVVVVDDIVVVVVVVVVPPLL